MEETLIIIMLKNKRTGFFEEELGAFSLLELENYLVNIYGEEDDKKEIMITMGLTTERDVLDWEYNAILDYYDEKKIKLLEEIITFKEEEDSYNPTWIITFKYEEDIVKMRNILIKILNTHKKELEDVYKEVKNREEEYL